MTTISPTAITLQQKKRLWKQYKYDQYKQLSKDQSLLFNYFYRNNDILGFISKPDQIKISQAAFGYVNRAVNVFFGTAFAVFFVDQILLRFLRPDFKIKRLRFLVFIGKYLFIPSLVFAIDKQFFMVKQEQFFFNMAQKYNFGFEQFHKANQIFLRALEVDRLQQLLQKRDKFDWTGVPQFPIQQKK